MKFRLSFFSFLMILFFVSVIKADSGNSYLSCIEKAEECRNMNEPQEAIKHYKDAMKYKNDDTNTLFALGQIYDQLGNTYEAEEYYEKVLARSADPKKVYDIGAYYFKTNQISKVEEIYLEAWRHRGNLFETNMGMGDYNFMVQDYNKAIEFYTIAIRKKNEQDNNMKALLYFRYSMSLDATGKRELALEACRMAARYKDSEEIREFYKQLGGK